MNHPVPTKADIALADAYDAWRTAVDEAREAAAKHGADSAKASKAKAKVTRLRIKLSEVKVAPAKRACHVAVRREPKGGRVAQMPRLVG